MMERGSGDDEIGLRERMSRFAPFFDQQAPFEHHVFTDRERSLCKHRPQFVGQPVGEFSAPMEVTQQLNAEPDLGERYRTDKQALKRLQGDEGHHVEFWFWPTKLGQDVGVEEPVRHSVTSRTGKGVRVGAISSSR